MTVLGSLLYTLFHVELGQFLKNRILSYRIVAHHHVPFYKNCIFAVTYNFAFPVAVHQLNESCRGCTEPSLEAGSRMHKPDDGRSDFMSAPGSGSRMDSTPMKPVSGWDSADDAARLKSSVMSREKMVSFVFHLVTAVSYTHLTLPTNREV